VQKFGDIGHCQQAKIVQGIHVDLQQRSLSVLPVGSARLSTRLDGFVWCFKQDVAVYAHRELVPRRDLNSGLHIQVAPSNLSPGLAQFLADCTSSGLGWRRVGKSALAASLGDLEGGGEHARQD
jgi:hypothetical protein